MESLEEKNIIQIYSRQRCKEGVWKANYPEMVICPDIFQNSPPTICLKTPRVVAEQQVADGKMNPATHPTFQDLHTTPPPVEKTRWALPLKSPPHHHHHSHLCMLSHSNMSTSLGLIH